MSGMCTSQNLGSRFRQRQLRAGVLWLAVALVAGFAMVRWEVAAGTGLLLVLPLAVGTYHLLAGTFGVCVYRGLCGQRRADHGEEFVPDERLRRRLMRRGMALVGVSCTLAGLATAAFVLSV